MVVNNIKQLLMEGKLRPGDRLPNELEISEGMGVSRGSVREAMKILSAFGLIDIRVGNGTYVSETPGNKLIDSLLFRFFVNNPDIQNLYELRQVIEIDILELTLKHYDKNEKQRRALKKNLLALEEMMTQSPTPEMLQENDISFHRIFGSCAQNVLMEQVYKIVIDFMEPSILITHKNQKGELAYRVHKGIVDVIEKQDYTRINEVITASVDTWSTLQNS